MYQLFQRDDNINRAVTTVSEMKALREKMYDQLMKVVGFYKNHPQYINSSHLLVRLMDSFTVIFNQATTDIAEYKEKISIDAMNKMMGLKFTSEISRGDSFNGVFYGKGSVEVIIGVDDDFDVTTNWKLWQPIKVLMNSHGYIDCGIPDGGGSDKPGIAVVTVNATMLMVQYQLWLMERARYSKDGMQRLSKAMFLQGVALTNMVITDMDYAIFNRFLLAYDGITPEIAYSSRKRHSFTMLNYGRELDNVLMRIVRIIKDRSMDFDSVLKHIPAVNSGNQFDALRIPNLANTSQVEWALAISRLDAIGFLLTYSGENNLSVSENEKNEIKRGFKSLMNDNVWRNVMPLQYHNIVFDKIRTNLLPYLD